ncbi:hypothetical protein JCM16303_006478 [Sporobolomyces ruberrimus]
MSLVTTFDPASVGRDTGALLGPQNAGWQVSFVLFGVYLTLHSDYLRSGAYKRLATPVKIVLWVVFGLVLVYEALAFTDNFRYMIIVERTPQDIILGWWCDFIVSLVAGTIAAIVQSFLTIRASVLIRNRRVKLCFLLVVGVCIISSLTGAILTTATSFMYYNDTISKVSLSFNQSVAIWLWTGAFVDLAISLCLFITLKQRIGGFNRQTDSLLRKLIVVSLQTAAYTSVLAVAGAVVSLVFKDSNPAFALLHFAFWTPLPPCYAISLYTTLASRQKINDQLGSHFSHLGPRGIEATKEGGGGGRSGQHHQLEYEGDRVATTATRYAVAHVASPPFEDPANLSPQARQWSQSALYSPTILGYLDELQRRDTSKTFATTASKVACDELTEPESAFFH